MAPPICCVVLVPQLLQLHPPALQLPMNCRPVRLRPRRCRRRQRRKQTPLQRLASNDAGNGYDSPQDSARRTWFSTIGWARPQLRATCRTLRCSTQLKRNTALTRRLDYLDLGICPPALVGDWQNNQSVNRIAQLRSGNFPVKSTVTFA